MATSSRYFCLLVIPMLVHHLLATDYRVSSNTADHCLCKNDDHFTTAVKNGYARQQQEVVE